MQRLVLTPEEAKSNILDFADAVVQHPKLRGLLGYFRAWYAEKDGSGQWKVGPSKVVGYHFDSLDEYESESLDGRETEAQLQSWYEVISADDVEFAEIDATLKAFLAINRKTPSSLYRLNVRRETHKVSSKAKISEASSHIADLVIAVCNDLPSHERTRIKAALLA